MNKFKSLADIYTEARGYKYKDSTVVERELKKLQKQLQDADFALKEKEREVDADLKANFHFGDMNSKDYNKEFEKRYKDGISAEVKTYKQTKKDLDTALAKYKTARNLEVPKPSPTLSDEYSSMRRGETNFKNTHGKMSDPMNHNYKGFKKLSDDAKSLYSELQRRGNAGEVFDIYKGDISRYNDIKATELANVMKLALDMGYELGENMFFWLEELSPKLAKQVNDYDGYSMEHDDYMKASHPYYKKIRNQYLNKYDGDEVKADRMLKLFRKRKQHESKMDNM